MITLIVFKQELFFFKLKHGMLKKIVRIYIIHFFFQIFYDNLESVIAVIVECFYTNSSKSQGISNIHDSA